MIYIQIIPNTKIAIELTIEARDKINPIIVITTSITKKDITYSPLLNLPFHGHS